MNRSVIRFALLALMAVSPVWLRAAPILVATNVLRVGTLRSPALDESSGIIASRNYPGAFWTHNDSDDYLFGVTKKGATLSVHRVNGVRFIDWEAIGIDGGGNLYLADIGDNNVYRPTRVVYKVREPNPYRSKGLYVQRRYELAFPDDVPTDCESFFVLKPYGYLVSKDRDFNGEVVIFRFPLASPAPIIRLQEVTRVKVISDVTAATVSRDKSRLALLTDEGAYCFFINGDVASVATARGIFTSFINPFVEAACFAGSGLLVSAETRELYLFNHPAFRTW